MQYNVKITQTTRRTYPYFSVYKEDLKTCSDGTLIVYFVAPSKGISINHRVQEFNSAITEWIESDFEPITENFTIQVAE